MAKMVTASTHKIVHKHKTSIGSSSRSRPVNKRKKLSFKRYRGQGR